MPKLFVSLLVLASCAFPSPLTSLGNTYNAILFGNLTGLSGDTEGRLLVGGNATFNASYSVGVAVIGSVLPPSSTRDDLIVFGNLSTTSLWGVNANAVYAGTLSGPGVSNISSGATTRQQSSITLQTGTGNALSNGTGTTLSALQSELVQKSQTWGALADQGVVTHTLSFGTLTLTGNNPTLNVFNISAAEYNASSIDITAPAGATVLINISGATPNISGGSINLHGVSRTNVLYNFFQATSLTLGARLLEGSLLAPLTTTVNLNGGAVNGIGVLAGTITQTSGFEFHNFAFDGNLPNPVPEPAWTGLTAALALAVVVLARR